MVDVSVVIATHNRAALVKEAIDSVLAQSVAVREILVVDDGSTDNTRQQLESYGDRIRAFYQPAGGASAARNRAMRAAEGRWIAFLDDDDVWRPSKIERQIDLAGKNQNLGLIYCSDYAVDERLQVLYERRADPQNRGDVFERLLTNNFVFTSCVMARRDAVERAGYMDLAFKFAQDWDLWLKIAASLEVDFVAEPLVLYRQSSSGCLTRDMKAAERLQEMQSIVERALKLRPISAATRRRAQCRLELQWASNWLGERKQSRAFSHSLGAIRAQPGCAQAYRLLAYSLLPGGSREWLKQRLG